MGFPPIALILLLCFAFASPLCGEDIPIVIQVSEALHRDRIPALKLDSVPFNEALSTIRKEWERTHPNLPFLVGVTDFSPGNFGYNEAISADCKNVSYAEALHLIATLGGRRFLEKKGVVQLQEIRWLVEDWTTTEYKTTPQVLAALGLSYYSSDKQVRAAFEKLGIGFRRGMKVVVAGNGRSVVVTSLPEQQNQIAGILLLLENGFRISK